VPCYKKPCYKISHCTSHCIEVLEEGVFLDGRRISQYKRKSVDVGGKEKVAGLRGLGMWNYISSWSGRYLNRIQRRTNVHP
jgi:hypothetical protein